MRSLRKQQSAFTLIELLVVLGIFAILGTATVANYRTGSRQSQLRLTAQELAANIRLAQSYAIGSKDYSDGTNPSQPPKGGWGIHIDQANNPHVYYVIADIDDDQTWAKGDNGLLKRVNLPENITIDEVVDDPKGNFGQATIFFRPPNPQVFVNTYPDNNLRITLRDNLSASTTQVRVNFFGLVEVQ